jgi:outer membrane protein assembly factor BamD
MTVVINFFFFNYFALLFLFKKEIEKSTINEENLESQMIEAYQEGLKNLEAGDVFLQQKNLMKQKFYFHNQNGHQNLL